MKHSILFCFTIAILAACGNNSDIPSETGTITKDTAVVKNYFPVNDFIKDEVNYADTFFTSFIKYTITDKKNDSVFIKPAEFRQWAAEFTTDELSKAALEKDYTESSFADQTTGMATFTYATSNASLPIKRVDVLAVPGEGFDKINSIYIEKVTGNGDTSVRKKVYWKSHKNVQVITETTIAAQSPKVDHFKIVWDASEK